MSTAEPTKHSLSTSIILHLLPGLATTVFFAFLAYVFRGRGIPAYFFLEVSFVAVTIPLFLLIMKLRAPTDGSATIAGLLAYRQKLPWYEYILWPLAGLTLIVLTFMTLGKIIDPIIKSSLFPWWPQWLNINDFAVNPGNYSKGWILAVWIIGIFVTTTGGPIAEELYFRGYLLPRIKGNPVTMILLGTILFALYHLFTPWMFATRVIALLPLYFIVWKRKSLALGIFAHCLLNLMGDTLSMIPLVFR